MIDFNDRFVGLMIGLLIVTAFFAFFAFFGEVEKKKKS